MQIFEQFRFLLVLVMFFMSFRYVSQGQLQLPSSQDQTEQEIEEEQPASSEQNDPLQSEQVFVREEEEHEEKVYQGEVQIKTERVDAEGKEINTEEKIYSEEEVSENLIDVEQLSYESSENSQESNEEEAESSARNQKKKLIKKQLKKKASRQHNADARSKVKQSGDILVS